MHQLSFRIRNERVNIDPPRIVDVQATREEIGQLVDQGYVVRERLIQGELLGALRQAADDIEAQALEKGPASEHDGFGGLFVRNLIDRHPTFARELFKFQPTLSVARALIGPQVQIHGSVLRVAYPALSHQNVEWHWHQRVVPDPEPPFFLRPTVIDNLVYLDDLTPDSGPLVVIPGSHKWNRDLGNGDHSEKEGQVDVICPAGSCVTSHSSLWHKARAPKPDAPKRRLLIFGYSPVWMKPIDPIAGSLISEQDEEARELLGRSGFY